MAEQLGAATPFRVITLNVNNVAANRPKQDAIRDIIKNDEPHAVILTETAQKKRQQLPPIYDPTLYEEFYTPASASNSSTGVALIVRRNLNPTRVSVPFSTATDGRICAVDISLPDEAKRRKSVRIVGLYASPKAKDLETDGALTRFWEGIRAVVSAAPADWILGGDYNAHLHPHESHSLNSSHGYELHRQKQQTAYREFLNACHGTDTWEVQDGVCWEHHWTLRAYGTPSTRRIIDRFSVSPGISCVRTETLTGTGPTKDDLVAKTPPSPLSVRQNVRILPRMPVPATNHRPVRVSLRLGCMVPPSDKDRYSRAPARLRQPKGNSATRAFEKMNDKLKGFMQRSPPPHQPPQSDSECDDLYAWCTEALTSSCNAAFQRSRSRAVVNPQFSPATSPLLRELQERRHQINRGLRAVKEDRFPALFLRYAKVRQALPEFAETSLASQLDKDESLRLLERKRDELDHSIRKETRRLTFVSTAAAEKREWQKAIHGGRLKHLFEPATVSEPPFLTKRSDSGEPETLEHQPEEKLHVWSAHFKKVLQRPAPPTQPKPWMLTSGPLAEGSPDKGGEDFVWPRPLSLPALRGVLGKGNPRPSPGPDGWEKWALRNASDEFLQIVIALANYIITHSYFPEQLKEAFITPRFKRGDFTDPKNYRGIAHSNLLYNIVSTWFGTSLRDHVWRKGLLNPTQISGQAGVQPGDALSLLEQLDVCLSANEETAFVLKRDHVQGYDQLHASAFEDALEYFGFNPAVTAFERARIGQCRMRVKSHDGVSSESFVTSGQTKQGDAPSSLRYTLSTSLLYWWWKRSPALDCHFPRIRTRNGKSGRFHFDNEKRLDILIRLIEATDDSLLLARSLSSLREITKLAEQFQMAYGIETNWTDTHKTSAFVLGKQPSALPEKIDIPLPGRPDLQVTVTREPVFLRTTFNNPGLTFNRILDLIEGFPLPWAKQLPLTLIRRAIFGLLIPKIRGVLNLQPLSLQMAEELDYAMARKVSEALGVRFRRTTAMFLPISQLGFGLPSIVRINGQAAISAVLRSLNSPLAPLAMVAAVTHRNWSCHGHSCGNPFFRTPGPQEELQPRPKPTIKLTQLKIEREQMRWIAAHRYVPRAWLAARQYAHLGGFSIVATTDQDITKARPMHVLNACKHASTRQPPSILFIKEEIFSRTPTLCRLPFKDWADEVLAELDNPSGALAGSWRVPWAQEIDAFKSWLTHFDLSDLAGPQPDCIESKANRRESYSLEVRRSFNMTYGSSVSRSSASTYATDGSFRLSSSGRSETAAAVVGAGTAALCLSPQQQTTSLDGELLGIVAALQHAREHCPEVSIFEIVTDSQNSVDIVRGYLQRGAEANGHLMKQRPSCELIRWLTSELEMTASRGVELRMTHVKAHTDSVDRHSQLNRAADRLASFAHSAGRKLPALTGWMQDYTVWCGAGYIGNTWKQELDSSLIKLQWGWLGERERKVFSRGDEPTPPVARHFYWRDAKGSVARTQLLTRLHEFPSNHHRSVRGKGTAVCFFCDEMDQTDAHLFAACPHFEAARQKVIADALEKERVSLIRKQLSGSGARVHHGNPMRSTAVDVTAEQEVGEAAPETELSDANTASLTEYRRYLMAILDPINQCAWWQGKTLPVEDFDLTLSQAYSAHNCFIILTNRIAAEQYGQIARGRGDKMLNRGNEGDEGDEDDEDGSGDEPGQGAGGEPEDDFPVL